MKTSTAKRLSTTVAQRLAGEDVRPGDFVTILSEIVEIPSFLWSCSNSLLPVDEPVRTRFTPRESGKPFQVTSVCLPFVYTRAANDTVEVFDTRRHQLVKIDRRCGAQVWKQLRKRTRG